MKLIVGLGNPSNLYKDTRHNLGFKVLDKISEKLRSSFKAGKGEYLIGEIRYKKNDILLVKPLTYMNNSGIAVEDVLDRYDILAEDCLVICDDLNFPLGKIKFRRRGGDGGNKGLESIIYHLETIEFPRLRIGIKNEKLGDDYSSFVLSKFERDEEKKINEIIDLSTEASIFWADYGIDEVMNKYNHITIE